jgi:hypothetical protein
LIDAVPVGTPSVEFVLTHPAAPTLVARYGVDPRRGGIYVEVADDDARVITYEALATEQAIIDVLDVLANFGFIAAEDVEPAIEWLDVPAVWRRGLPAPGVRRALSIIEELGEAAGA